MAISYGTYTITEVQEGSQIWTSSVAPSSPNYTFTISNLTGDSETSIKVGDIIMYSYYRYTVLSISNDGTTVLTGNRVSIRGATGAPSVTYSLIVSNLAIIKDKDGNLSPSSITVTAKSQTGSNAMANYTGRIKIETTTNNSTWTSRINEDASTKTYTIPTDTVAIRCSLYLNGGTTTLLDQQTIPVVSDGLDGTNVTITSTSITYQEGTSGTVKPTGTWKTNVQSVAQGNFLWTKTVVNYSDGSSTESYSVARQGSNGINGTSPTVSNTVVEYQQSTNGKTVPTGTWNTTPPTAIAEQFMWTRTTITYSDSATAISYSVSRNGTNGTSISISSTSVTYQKGTSGTVKPTGTWETNVQPVGEGEYLWTKTVVTYSDSSKTESYSVSRNAVNGTNGTSPTVTSTVTEYVQSNNGTTTPTSGWNTSPPSTVTAGWFMWTRVTVTYSDNATSISYTVSKNGTNGNNGINTATVYLYKKGTTAPSVPSGNTTYTFSTKKLTGTLDSWSQTIPTTGDGECYVTAAVASSSGTTDTIATGEWSTPIQFNGTNGTNGTDGTNGLNQATIFLYKRGASVTKPTTSVTYTFSTGALSAEPNSWKRNIPTIDGNPCWVVTATAIGNGTTATITGSNWSDPVKLVEDGSDGDDAYSIVLTNENHTFAGNSTSALASEMECNVIAYKGTTQVAATIGAITGQPTGMTTSLSNNGTTNASFTVAVTTNMVTKNGVLTIPITVDGKNFTKKFTYSLALDGVSVTNVTSTNNTTDGGTSVVTITMSDGTQKTFNVKNGNKGSIGDTAEWFYGTALTHKSGTATTTITGAVVGSMYLNTETSLVYKCTNINGSTMTWTYAGDLTTGVINNIEIGGRNLVRNTAIMPTTKINGYNFRASGGTVTHVDLDNSPINGITGAIRITNTSSSSTRIGMAQDSLKNCFITGEKYTMSCWVRASANMDIIFQIIWASNERTTRSSSTILGYNFNVGTDWTYLKWEGATLLGTQVSQYSAGYVYALDVPTNGWLEVCGLKVEKGNKATDWTPAPEDIEEEIASKADSSVAVEEEQLIYISKASGTNTVAGTTTWVTGTGDVQNTWTTKRPTYNSSYPVLFIAKQKKTVSGTVTCTTPLKDDTTTVIDGGHITTGTIDASQVTVTNIDASEISTGTLKAEVIGANSLSISQISGLQSSLNGKQPTGDYATNSDVTTAINNIEVGGRNLLLKSDTGLLFLWETAASNGGTLTTEENITVNEWNTNNAFRAYGTAGSTNTLFGIIKGNIGSAKSLNNQAYTFSIYIKNNSSTNTISISPNNIGDNITVNPNEVKRVIINAIGNGVNNIQFNFYTNEESGSYDFVYWHPKIEYGNKATDWTPAQEDINTEINNAEENAEKVATNYLAFDNTGIMIADMKDGEQIPSQATGKNVFIDNDSVDIRNGQTVLSSFSNNAVILGQLGKSRLVLSPTMISGVSDIGYKNFNIISGDSTEERTITKNETFENSSSESGVFEGNITISDTFYYFHNITATVVFNYIWDGQQKTTNPLTLIVDDPVEDETATAWYIGETERFSSYDIDKEINCSVQHDGETTILHFSADAELKPKTISASYEMGNTATCSVIIETKVYQNTSYTFGSRVVSSEYGDNSFAIGEGLIASSDNQIAIGKFNNDDPNKNYAFMVGNGVYGEYRSNAFAVDWNGHVETGDIDGYGLQLSENSDSEMNDFIKCDDSNDNTIFNVSKGGVVNTVGRINAPNIKLQKDSTTPTDYIQCQDENNNVKFNVSNNGDITTEGDITSTGDADVGGDLSVTGDINALGNINMSGLIQYNNKPMFKVVNKTFTAISIGSGRAYTAARDIAIDGYKPMSIGGIKLTNSSAYNSSTNADAGWCVIPAFWLDYTTTIDHPNVQSDSIYFYIWNMHGSNSVNVDFHARIVYIAADALGNS